MKSNPKNNFKLIAVSVAAFLILAAAIGAWFLYQGLHQGDEPEGEEAPCTHTFGEWMSVTEATCEEMGQEKRICSVCEEKEERPVAALDHSYDTAWSHDDTEHYRVCTRTGCTRKADAAAHTPDATYLCTICGYQGKAPETDVSLFTFVQVDGGYKLTKYNGSVADVVIPATYLGEPVKRIGNGAFKNCEILTSVRIPDAVWLIEEAAFFGSKNLKTVTFGESSQLQSISTSAFGSCTALTSITLSQNGPLKSIGDFAFEKCKNLTDIQIPDGVTNIGSYAFNGCQNLASIHIPDGVYSILEQTFSNCTNLTSVTFSENSQLAVIGSGSFTNCKNLASFTFPKDVYSIDSAAFSGCEGLKSVYITGLDQWFAFSFRDASASPLHSGADLYVGNIKVTNLIIPQGITEIRDYAFCGTSIESVTIHDHVTSIGHYAFGECTSLATVIFEDPHGWFAAETALSSLTDPTQNAMFLTSTYCTQEWHRE